jgi:hypothetical protein
MKEKMSEYPIDHPLTEERRREIDRFIQANASRVGRAFTHEWDESGSQLRLASDPVEWQFVFHPERVEVYGSAPALIRMLYTDHLRNKVNEVILEMLDAAGFFDPGTGQADR